MTTERVLYYPHSAESNYEEEQVYNITGSYSTLQEQRLGLEKSPVLCPTTNRIQYFSEYLYPSPYVPFINQLFTTIACSAALALEIHYNAL